MKGDKTLERMVEQVQGQMLQELGVPVAPQIPQQPQGAMQNEQMWLHDGYDEEGQEEASQAREERDGYGWQRDEDDGEDVEEDRWRFEEEVKKAPQQPW